MELALIVRPAQVTLEGAAVNIPEKQFEVGLVVVGHQNTRFA